MCCQQMILCVLVCLCVVCVPGCVCGFVLLCSCLSLSFFSKMCIDGMPPFIVFILSCQSIRTQVAALVTKRARCYEKLFKKGRKSTKCSDMSTSAPFISTRIKFISIIGTQIPQKQVYLKNRADALLFVTAKETSRKFQTSQSVRTAFRTDVKEHFGKL